LKKAKGRPIKEHPYRPHEFIRDVSQDRLALFGAVSLIWNDLEGALDATIGAALDLPEPLWAQITSRINGFDGKCEILVEAARLLHKMPDEHIDLIVDTLGAAKAHKSYRDGIVHAKILDPDADTAPTFERRGSVGEVFVTKEAMQNLYERIGWIRSEIEAVLFMFVALHDLREAETEDEILQVEQQLKVWNPRLLDRQAQRKALPPLPQFLRESPSPPKMGGQQEPPD
jgi:hypothetical protein